MGEKELDEKVRLASLQAAKAASMLREGQGFEPSYFDELKVRFGLNERQLLRVRLQAMDMLTTHYRKLMEQDLEGRPLLTKLINLRDGYYINTAKFRTTLLSIPRIIREELEKRST